MAEPKKAAGRLAFIDWTRGFAAVVMLQGHIFDSFTRNGLRDKGPYMFSQFLGGLAAGDFSFSDGHYVRVSDGQPGEARRQRMEARSGGAEEIQIPFSVGVSIPHSALRFWFPHQPGERTAESGHSQLHGYGDADICAHGRVHHAGTDSLVHGIGLVIAALAPVVSMIDGSGVPWIVRSYFFPSYNYFGFFPWASFLAFGMVAGSVLRTVKQEEMPRAMLWMMAIGVGTGGGGAATFEYGVFGLCEERILAEQSGADHDQTRASCWRYWHSHICG